MEGSVVLIVALVLLDLASLRWGVDSRFGLNDPESPYGQEWHIWG